MDRQNRDGYEHQNHQRDYDGNAGYSDNDEHYHSARNLTDQFEQEYQRNRGQQHEHRDLYNPNRAYNQNRSRDSYSQYSRDEDRFRDNANYQQNEPSWNRDFGDDSSRNRQSQDQDDYRSYQRMDSSDQNQSRGSIMRQVNMRRSYGTSDFDRNSDRFNTLNSGQNREGAGSAQPYYGGHQNANYGGSSGSSYGGSNYGGGTGYSGEHRGRSFGNEGYGTSSSNYGDTGAMNGAAHRIRYNCNTALYNSDRGASEADGF